MTLRLGSFLNDVRGAVLTGLSTATNSVVAATDGILVAIGKLQAQVLAPNFTGTVKQTTSGLTPGVYLTQSGSGNASYATWNTWWPYAGYAYNYKYITADAVTLAADQFTNGRGLVMGDVVHMDLTGGSTVNGTRIARASHLRVLVSPTSGANAGDFMGATWDFAQAVVPVIGSTSSAPRGNLYGINPQVQLAPGATNYVSIMAQENDVEVDAGASVQYKWGVTIATVGTDAVHGSVGEAALHIGAVPAPGGSGYDSGWLTGIMFSDFNGGGTPITSAGTLLRGNKFGGGAAIPVLHGIDLNSFTFSGFAFRSPSFSVDGSGNLNAASGSLTGLTIGTGGLMVNGSIGSGGQINITQGIGVSGASAFAGGVGINDTGTSASSQLTISATSNTSIGARITLVGDGATTPSKSLRAKSGVFQILNNAASVAILTVDDAGNMTVPGTIAVSGSATLANVSASGTVVTTDLNVASTGAIAGAWNTSFTPVISPYLGTGSFGTGGNAPSATLRYKKIGRIVLFEATVTFAAASQGTASGTAGVAVTLPFAPAVTTVAFGRENVVNGKLLQGLIVSGGSTMNVVDYANAYPGTSGSINNCVLLLSGTYEASS